MPRRAHKKSRAGCLTCKRRHLKCDEHHPRCVNCSTAGASCSFENGPTSISGMLLKAPNPPVTVSGPSTPPSQPTGSRISTPLPPRTFSQPSDSGPGLNLEHLELLHNFVTRTYTTFMGKPEQQEFWRNVPVRHALVFPFLMFQILAVSALHLAHLHPSHSERYYASATRLQNQSMSEFNAMQQSVDQSSCAAVLLFSSLLALHVLADPTRTQGVDFSGYVDHFTSCISLMRSVRSLVISDFWDYLSTQAELEPLLKVESPAEPFDIPTELRALQKIAQDNELAERARVAYENAVNRLEWLYAISGVPRHVYATVRWILGWPAQLSEEYLELLHERRPEALIILSYYGVLLTYYRESWIVGDKGIQLVKAIDAHLGGYWDQWMQWPREVVVHAEQGGLPPAASKERQCVEI